MLEEAKELVVLVDAVHAVAGCRGPKAMGEKAPKLPGACGISDDGNNFEKKDILHRVVVYCLLMCEEAIH